MKTAANSNACNLFFRLSANIMMRNASRRKRVGLTGNRLFCISISRNRSHGDSERHRSDTGVAESTGRRNTTSKDKPIRLTT